MYGRSCWFLFLCFIISFAIENKLLLEDYIMSFPFIKKQCFKNIYYFLSLSRCETRSLYDKMPVIQSPVLWYSRCAIHLYVAVPKKGSAAQLFGKLIRLTSAETFFFKYSSPEIFWLYLPISLNEEKTSMLFWNFINSPKKPLLSSWKRKLCKFF
jgi:hypothetical protein